METENIKTFSGWDRAQHMRELHAQGRYKGVDTKIGLWNVSQERKDRMRKYYEQNHLDKTSWGFGSEHHQRLRNRELLHNKFQGESGYLYLLDFPGSIKVGFSKDWERRTTKQILGGKVLKIISGPTNDLADLEFDTFMEFQDFTQLDSTKTRYTEYMDKTALSDVQKFLDKAVRKNPKLRYEIK
jgi:hypothetical protein